jgi:hypothetical protein
MVVLLSWFGRTHILGGPVFGGYVRRTLLLKLETGKFPAEA